MPATPKKSVEAAIWSRVLGSEENAISGMAARAILKIDFPKVDKERMHLLAEKARTGTLTQEEKDEIDAYGRIGSFISIMKSMARVTLKKGPAKRLRATKPA